MRKIVLDTSVIAGGSITTMIDSGKLRDILIIIPVAALDELQSQATKREEQGFVGLEELKRLQDVSRNNMLEILFDGPRPTTDDIGLSERGRIDAIIKDAAKNHGATLFTSDRVQRMVAEAEGIPVEFIPAKHQAQMEFLKYFDEDTMSVHLKEGMEPYAKRGKPGSVTLTKISDTILSKHYLLDITRQILDADTDGSNTEISRPGATVIQHGQYRISITQPPFSEKYEITIVHPIVKMSLEDYDIPEKLMKRFSDRAEGVLISGAPGSGKSTLASGLANFYSRKGKIVKTFESPRDLQVDDGITQYTRLDGSFENSADILLLVRPDHTVFDEVRRRQDFEIFADLRLTGVGMIGVVHANSPLDAIQRFIGKIELGIIPSVIDTVVYVDAGRIKKVYGLELKVKVPSGMVEQDLARPVIEISNFETDTCEYEIYTFGEENVIVPVQKGAKSGGVSALAADRIRDVLRRFDPGVQVEIVSENAARVRVAKRAIPAIIGRAGSNISELEKMLGIHLDVAPKEGGNSNGGAQTSVPFSFKDSRAGPILSVGDQYAGMSAEVMVGQKPVTTTKVGRRGQIQIPKRSDAARKLSGAESMQDITVRVRDS